MHQTSKYSALALGLTVLAVILFFALRDSRRPKAGFNVQVATDTCTCYMDSPGIVVLHIYTNGGLAINSESVSHGQLARRLRLIYGIRAVRVLYLFPENGTPSQRIAEVVDVVKHLREEIKAIPVPREVRTEPAMKIQMGLVTSESLSAPCPKDCFNWGTQGLPVSPLASSEKAASDSAVSARLTLRQTDKWNSY